MSDVTLQVNTKALPNSRLAVTIEIPAERCQKSYNEAVSRLSRSVKLPGFRKGKVPKAVILQQIGIPQINATALESLIEGVWREALQKEEIEPLSEPELINGFENLLTQFQPGKTLNLTLETDIAPNPELKTTKGLKAEVEHIAFNPKKVEELIEQSRKQLATLIPIENRPAEIGDVAVVSFKGNYVDDGSEIEGGSSESMDIDLEEGRMIPGFIEGIIGMGIGDEKLLQCEFPQDYSQKDAQGRKANFKVKIKDLKTRELPELDDSFAKQAGDKANMAELRKDLETRLKEDNEQQNKNNRQEALIQALMKELKVDLPKSLIDQEVRHLIEQTARKFAQQGMDVKSMFTSELVKSLMDSSRPEAETNLRRKLALNALAKEEKIELDNQKIEAKFKEVQQQLASEKNIDPQKLREAVVEDLLQEKLLTWLEENCSIIERSSDKPSITDESSPQKTTSKKHSSKNKAKNEKDTSQTPKS